MLQHNNFAEKTTVERADAAIRLSEHTYAAIDQNVGGETRGRRILRLGLNAVAGTLEDASSTDRAGSLYQSILFEQLDRSGHMTFGYQEWPKFQQHRQTLAPAPHIRLSDMDDLANRYSDVQRATLSADGEPERNSSHVVHLSVMALTYAIEKGIDLNMNKVAVYALLHDIVEAYAGDTPSYKMTLAEQLEKERKEHEALETIERLYGAKFPGLIQAIHDYEGLVNDEAKYTKTTDKNDPHYTHLRNAGFQLVNFYGVKNREEYLEDTDNYTKRIAVYGNKYPDVMDIRQELVHRVADKVEWPEAA